MIWDRIAAYNRGRDEERLALKYKTMAFDDLAFFSRDRASVL